MKYWLIKSEPYKWSWDDQAKKGVEHWDGVRNYQASNNMKAMEIGDLAFFYHSNEGKEIVGICEVASGYYPDHTDESGRFGMVDFKAIKPMPKPVTLKQIKETKSLAEMALIKQMRLSVCPVRKKEWDIICKMGGL
ncbi:MAG: EVE domain-containing protein [Pseudomonadota bacterium]